MSDSKTIKLLMCALLLIIALGVASCTKKEESQEVKETMDITHPNVKPYRSFITIEQFEMEQNGEFDNPISNVRLEIEFPNKARLDMPDAGQFWTIGNNQVQKIDQHFEVPWALIHKDGFDMTIQIARKGTWIKPCEFKIRNLSEFNRAYICRTDEAWQRDRGLTEEELDKEAIRIRVFTDRHPSPKPIPKNPIALQ